jgi:cell division protein FtsB
LPIEVSDLPEFLRLLRAHPEWRSEIRREILGDELFELPALVRDLAVGLRALQAEVRGLAEAQARTDQRIDQLVEAQARTDRRIDQLVEAQARTDERIGQLVEAQAATEKQVAELAGELRELKQEVRGLRAEVGSLSQIVGSTVEDSGRDALVSALRRQGFRLLDRARAVQLDGEGELDAVVEAEGADGQRVWAISEAKVRLREDHVRAWAARFWSPSFRKQLARFGMPGPYRPYIFGIVLYFDAPQLAAEMERSGLGPVGILSGRETLIEAPLVPPG